MTVSLQSTPAHLRAVLADAVEVSVEAGAAFEKYPPVDQPPLLTVHDGDMVQRTVQELAAADLSPGVVVPALGGLTLVFRDGDGRYLGSVGVLDGGWVRAGWGADALLPGRLTILEGHTDELQEYVGHGWSAVDAVVPVYAAARHTASDSAGPASVGAGEGPRSRKVSAEHAATTDGTLCGLPPQSVEVYRHHFGFRTDDCRECCRLGWASNPALPWPRMLDDAASLYARWETRWGNTPPLGHLLRGDPAWVRFHSLPGSQRYAETAAQYEVLLRRHHTIIAELVELENTPVGGAAGTEVLVLTQSQSAGDLPVPMTAPTQAALSDPAFWRTFRPSDEQTRHHVFVSRLPLRPESLDPLLMLVADDGTRDVILCDEDLTWFFHPYDGGADVMASSLAVRDELRRRHPEWLPRTSSGL